MAMSPRWGPQSFEAGARNDPGSWGRIGSAPRHRLCSACAACRSARAQQTEPPELTQARQYFDALDYEQAMPLLDRAIGALEPMAARDPAQRGDAGGRLRDARARAVRHRQPRRRDDRLQGRARHRSGLHARRRRLAADRRAPRRGEGRDARRGRARRSNRHRRCDGRWRPAEAAGHAAADDRRVAHDQREPGRLQAGRAVGARERRRDRAADDHAGARVERGQHHHVAARHRGRDQRDAARQDAVRSAAGGTRGSAAAARRACQPGIAAAAC